MLTYLSQEQALEHLSKFKCQVYSDFTFSIGDIDFVRYGSGVCYATANLQGGIFRFYKRIKLKDFLKIKGYVDTYLSLNLLTSNSTSLFEQAEIQEYSKTALAPVSTLQAKIESVYKCTKGRDGKNRYFILNADTGKYKPISKKRLLN